MISFVLGFRRAYVLSFFHRLHEFIGGSHRDIEIVEVVVTLFALDEMKNVRVVDPEDAHIGSPSRSSLLDRFCRRIKNAHERDRAARNSLRRTHHIILRPDPRERETCSASAFLNQGHLLHGVKDLIHGISHRENKTGGELLKFSSCIHQCRRIGKEVQRGHQRIEFVFNGREIDLGMIEPVRLGNVLCHAPKKLFRCFHNIPLRVFLQVTFLQYGHGILRQLAQLHLFSSSTKYKQY